MPCFVAVASMLRTLLAGFRAVGILCRTAMCVISIHYSMLVTRPTASIVARAWSGRRYFRSFETTRLSEPENDYARKVGNVHATGRTLAAATINILRRTDGAE